VHLLANVKSQNSLMDKLMTRRNYRTMNAIDDIIRCQISGSNYEETVFLLHHFINYFLKNTNKYFVVKGQKNGGDTKNGGLKIVDKGITNTENVNQKNILQALPDDMAKDIIMNV
jgi:hypothetical protein